MRAIGIAIPFFRRRSGVPIDAQAQAHFNRVIADGGVVPSGLSGVNAFFSAVKAIYGTSDINTAISAAYDAHYLGYKLGAGSGTTLGQAAQKLYAPKGIFGGIGTGSAFYDAPGVSNNFVSTPNAAANQITGDIDIRVQVDYRNNAASQFFVSKTLTAVSNHGYDFFVNSSNLLIYQQTRGGVFNGATSSVGIGATFTGWLRMTRVSSTGVVTFFTSLDGVNYTQLGTTFTLFTGALDNPNSPVNIGSYFNGNNVMNGKIYRATIANSIGGTPVVDFNANQYTGANTWTSTTSEVWTVNSTGAGLADVTQTTAASQPLLLAHTGENYWFGSGVNGNFASTPNAAANQITGDIEFIAKVNFQDSGNQDTIFIKSDAVAGTSYCYAFWKNGNNLAVSYSNGGTVGARVTSNSSATLSSVGYTYGTDIWVKANRSASSGDVKFYYGSDGLNWTQLGTTQSTTPQSIFNASIPLWVGDWANILFQFKGKIYRATISNSIGGTPVVDFNPASYNPATSQTQWTSATGEVWTINTGTATTGYKGAVITKTIVQGDGVDDTFGGISINIQTVYNARRLFTNSGSGAIAHLYTNSTRYLERRVNGFSIFNGTYLNSLLANNINLNYIMGQYNSSNSIISVNNSADIVGNSGSTAPSGTFNVFNVGNHTLNTFVCTNALDAALQRTAMYNYIRSINGNSF